MSADCIESKQSYRQEFLLAMVLFLLLGSRDAFSGEVKNEIHDRYHCQLSAHELEKAYLAASKKVRLMTSDNEILEFIENNCNAFIRSFLKRNYLEDHPNSKLFSYENIEADIRLMDEVQLKVLSLSGLGNLAILDNKEKATYFAGEAYALLPLIKLKSNTALSAVFSLSRLYARLGDFKTAYTIANTLDKESKEALIIQLKDVRP